MSAKCIHLMYLHNVPRIFFTNVPFVLLRGNKVIQVWNDTRVGLFEFSSDLVFISCLVLQLEHISVSCQGSVSNFCLVCVSSNISILVHFNFNC